MANPVAPGYLALVRPHACVVLWCLWALLPLGCSPGHVEAPPPAAAPECVDPLPEEQAELPAARSFEPPASQLAIEVRVPKQRLIKALSGQVPEVLASGQRTVGPGARLSYQVKRGEFELGVDGDDLLILVPIRASAHVCMPLGPLCPTVGSCAPALTTTVRVPVLLDERGGFGPSKVSVKVDRGCSIGGVNASGQFLAAAKQQTKQLERRIDESMAAIRPVVQDLWRSLHEPVEVDRGACIQPRWRRIVQQRPELTADALLLRVAIQGELSLEQPCAKAQERAPVPPLPKAERVDAVPEQTELALPIQLAWDEVGGQLSEQLIGGQPAQGDRISAVQVRGTAAPAQAERGVAVELTLAGPRCGQVWTLSEPWFDAAAERVKLRDTVVAPGQPGRAELLSDGAVGGRLAELGLSLGVTPSAAGQALRTLVERAAAPHQKRAAIEAAFDTPPSWTVPVFAESLTPVVTQVGVIRVEPR